ncbi:MAG: type ISP restriction/modification enzyme, partial [Endomicrobiales bacterium]
MKGNSPDQAVFDELKRFSKSLTTKFSSRTAGQPEAQLKSPIEQLFGAYAATISRAIVLKDESSIERLGRPDYAVESNDLLIGYIELKDPEKGANPEKYKGHDAAQWERFKNIPNILYTSANEWALYQNGQLTDKIVRFDGDVCTDGENAVTEQNAKALFALFAAFTSWSPIVPVKPKELAAYLAPFCRLIREDVVDALKDNDSLMHSLKAEIQNLLFPDADNFRFADAYAQTVTFALLLAHLEQADVLDLRNAYDTLEKHHTLLSRSLEFLTDKSARKEISTSLSLLQRVIHATPCEALTATKETADPWLFFYEEFLEAYDPELRKKAGVYYTPLEVVQCQVRLIDELLQKQLGKEMGFVEAGVATLDPAVGTGTYLLAIIEHALSRVEKEEGVGAVKGGARSLIHNLHGFEWMVGPYAVAQLRFSQALTRYKVALPDTGTGIYLTNTLESPHVKPPAPPLFHKPIAQEHERALKVKDSQHVLVCLGNPPYGRHESAAKDGSNKETTGGWVRYGEESETPILESFIQPTRDAGHGVHLKNIYNLYVYFIRWALWKVFEHKTAVGPGIVSFITASSYIDGDAFSGMREHLRRICDHIDVIDLGGEGRGTRKDENVFAIQTPVAIFIAWRKKLKSPDTPAVVRYTKIEGTREEKLDILGKIKSENGLKWEKASEGWLTPFRPIARGEFATWPIINDIFPWQNGGTMAGRTWIIAPSKELLKRRLSAFEKSVDKIAAFKNSPTGRKYDDKLSKLTRTNGDLLPLAQVKSFDDIYVQTYVQPYSYRSFDRQFIIGDIRFLDRAGPSLWYAHGDKQIYLAGLLTKPLGDGPALTACAEIPDKDFFSNRGAKDVIPLFLDD